MITIRTSEPVASEDTLRAVEGSLGFLLPREYKEFLLVHNGGKPMPDEGIFGFESDGGRTSSRVRAFYSVGGTSEYYDMLKNKEVFDGRIVPPMLAIGCDDGGNQVLICCEGENAGGVFFWDHETDEPHFIASTFREFLQGLHRRE